MKLVPKKSIPLVIALILGFIYHYKYINEYPSHIHAWAQADRYALSLGFVDNGLNFFKPQTFIYNPPIPYQWNVPSQEPITAVDCPIHDFIPAVIMSISGNHSPWIFRVYVLLYSILGLWFLFKLSYALSGNYLKSLFVIVFAATSPIYVYYQASFLPTIPSLSNAIIGVYFYYRYFKNNNNTYFVGSIFFLTLATLARTTFAVPFIAILCVEFLRFLRKETGLLSKIIPVSIAVLVILAYYVYNKYLTKCYGTMFLNYILPPANFKQAVDIIKNVFENWLWQYFSKAHYLFFACAMLVAMFTIGRKTTLFKLKNYFSLFVITYLFGCFLFSILMLRQFPVHDYYFLDTFFFPILLILILLLTAIPEFKNKYIKYGGVTFAALVVILLIAKPIKTQELRRETTSWDKVRNTINNFRNSSAYLDSLGIPKTAKMLVVDAVAPNLPFIFMQRKGFAIIDLSKENIKNALTWNYDYIVFQDEYFISEIYPLYPDILSRLEVIADNKKIMVCKLSHKAQQHNLMEFLGLNTKQPLFTKCISFEEKRPDTLWQNVHLSDKYVFTGSYSGYISKFDDYGLTFKTKHLPEITQGFRTLLFSSYFLKDTVVNSEIVFEIKSNGKTIYYRSISVNKLIKYRNVWGRAFLVYQLPMVTTNDYEFAIYIWNPGKSNFYFDDFSFSLY
jgi:hypothetical protein